MAGVPLTPAVTLALADAEWVDLAALAVVGLFLMWGALRGAVRQTLGLVAVALAFALAGWFSPRLVSSMRKIATLSPDGLACLAWWTVLLGTLVLCGVGIHSFRERIDKVKAFGKADPWIGGFVGVLKGFVALALVFYAVLGSYVDEPGPSVVTALRESRAARTVARVSHELRPALVLPPRVAARVDDVNSLLEPPVEAPKPPTEGAGGPAQGAGAAASSHGDGPR